MFIDQVKVYARAGHGGKGCVAFQREAYRPKGGPSGGNGGRGGSVILEADHDINNLVNQYYTPRLIAENGQAGMGKGMDGLAGKDIIVKVPCGTLVWRLPVPPDPADQEMDEEEIAALKPTLRQAGNEVAWEFDLSKNVPVVRTNINETEKELVCDLLEHGQRFVLCKGGRGGLGNRNFATPTRQTPRFAQPGEEGDEGYYLLELRIVADAALVGFPNAGKSTLLTAISRARPKIASYPFTTLHPQVGIVEDPVDYHRMTVCDVPGLIPGAHENKGLGHAFLRHIRRCKVIVLLLDMAGSEGRKPWEDYRQLLQELEYYDKELLNRPRLVVANKMDEPGAEELLKQFKRHIRKTPVIRLSAAFDEGISEFLAKLRETVDSVQEDPPLPQGVSEENA
ncbi:MAG: GTPase ObgE [Verrucomicrobia bacterium]|jgi:GTP-binding protein|nr:GTPase ObgE [Verrucomicrobiota bacterium]MBO7391460.1 GTPase ObgE [Verrucomicrobiota bacterium]MBO7524029.1 GTPase ObgE [Verrucomicrobiota bacterium]MBR4249860.1 GTPase ObgE [Verrucomicrobiota bacterium]